MIEGDPAGAARLLQDAVKLSKAREPGSARPGENAGSPVPLY